MQKSLDGLFRKRLPPENNGGENNGEWRKMEKSIRLVASEQLLLMVKTQE